MRIFIMWLLLLSVLLSCSEKPELSLPEETIVEVISDLMVAETAINRSHRTLKDSVEQVYYKQIYAIHGIDSLTLANDLAILQQDEELSKKIYNLVSKHLEKLSDDFKKKNEKKTQTLDESVGKVKN